MDTSFSEFTLSVPTLFSFTQRQWRYNEVDGWGTLYLPADTFEVLRVKSTLERTDSAYVEQFGQGFTFPEPETIEYKWIAQGMDLPFCRCGCCRPSGNGTFPLLPGGYHHWNGAGEGNRTHSLSEPCRRHRVAAHARRRMGAAGSA